MTNKNDSVANPWYKEFWAWFIFTPLIVVVIACVFMVSIAFKTSDDRVVDDYYEVGKTINQEFTPEKFAKSQGIRAVLEFNIESSEVGVKLKSFAGPVDAESIELFLSHPAQADKDQTLYLSAAPGSSWTGELTDVQGGRWYVRLSGFDSTGADETWRLQGEVNLDSNRQLELF